MVKAKSIEKKDKHMTFKTNQRERDMIKEVCRRTGKNKAELIIGFFENCTKNNTFEDMKSNLSSKSIYT